MTAITLQLPPDLEQKLRDEAAKQGIDPDRYILNALQERFQAQASQPAPLPKPEADLLQQINLGLSSDRWEHYHTLLAKRRTETLTPAEHATLIDISDQIEQANVPRIQALIELAKLRGQSLPIVMQELGIQPAIDA